MSVSIEITGVSKTYDRPGAPPVPALMATNLTLSEGEFFSLVGPSGCGKSTILNMVAGLLAPTGGSLRIGGRPVTGPNPGTGIVFQKATLLRWLTVYENIVLPVKVARPVTPQVEALARHLLELTGLFDFKDRYPTELSGGMQQRAAIVRALINDPAVLLMDEPFSALDEFTRETLNDELLRLWGERPKTVLFITHNISEAVYLSDRIGVMRTKPGGLKEVVDVRLPRPRLPSLRSEAHYYDVVRNVRMLIGPMHEEATITAGAA